MIAEAEVAAAKTPAYVPRTRQHRLLVPHDPGPGPSRGRRKRSRLNLRRERPADPEGPTQTTPKVKTPSPPDLRCSSLFPRFLPFFSHLTSRLLSQRLLRGPDDKI